MEPPKNPPKPPREYGKKPDEKPERISLRTPGQRRLLDGTVNPVIPLMIERFGLDINAHSSLEALDSLKISHAVDTLFAQLSGSPPPPPIDLSRYAPLSPADEKKRLHRIHQKKLTSLPPGLTLDPKGKTTFDTQWKQKGIHPTELPQDHPDWTPF